MQRTLSYRASHDGRFLLGEHTIAFRLTPRCERGATALGVPAGERVLVELLDDGGHLLDSFAYVVPPSDG
jgi:hypothetical protein